MRCIARPTVRSLLAILILGAAAPAARAETPSFTADHAAVYVQLALDCTEREYPNQIQHVMQSDADRGTPRSLHPAFFGCYDWHSSVHGHWLLARFARLHPAHPLAAPARAVLERHLQPGPLAAETAYLLGEGREPWQRPYGLAWLLQLVAELHEWDDPAARRWRETLRPLEAVCRERFLDWLPKLAYPIRTGEHSQTAFAFGLVLDYAHAAGRADLAALVTATSLRLYETDRGIDLAFEPSGQDFLSPALAQADLMRRVLEPERFAAWLANFLPQLPHDGSAEYLPVAVVTDRVDGKLAHLDGLNLSRAWMLEGIAAGLPAGDPRRASLLGAALAHAADGLAAVTGEHYAGGHWLGTYAMYLTSRRGLTHATP
jgi:hypothetical protein